MDERFISIRECETKHDAIEQWIKNFEIRMDRLENKFWWIITLLVGNLVGVLILLLRIRL